MGTAYFHRRIPPGRHEVHFTFTKDAMGRTSLFKGGVKCGSYEHMPDFVFFGNHIAPECRPKLWHVAARMCLRLRGDPRAEEFFREA